MRALSVLALALFTSGALMSIASAPARSAECVKTFDQKKKTALEGDACASQALNDADRDLNASYKQLNRAYNNMGLYLWFAQQHWVDERNLCVRSGKEDDCVAITKARAAFFDLQAGSESGRHRMIWFGKSSFPVGPGGYKIERIFYQFLKPESPGETIFNAVIQEEYRKSLQSFVLAQKLQSDAGRSAGGRCSDWVILGTATLAGGIMRVPVHSFPGCRDPKAAETTSFIAVDMDHARRVQ